ncbi:hypothetical protein V8C86DRAFT_124765 [Haematococcus lacustris]
MATLEPPAVTCMCVQRRRLALAGPIALLWRTCTAAVAADATCEVESENRGVYRLPQNVILYVSVGCRGAAAQHKCPMATLCWVCVTTCTAPCWWCRQPCSHSPSALTLSTPTLQPPPKLSPQPSCHLVDCMAPCLGCCWG